MNCRKGEETKKGHGHGHDHGHAHGHGKKDDNHHSKKEHDGKHGGEPQSSAPTEKVNPNLTKRDLKLLEKLHAKIEYLEIRDEHAEADKIREQIDAINDNANGKALKKAEKKAAKGVAPA